MKMLSFFKEREARDELGIGGIRDAISDQLFPGTSTIQTRLRYVFFIPWLFAQLEQKNTTATEYPAAAREAEGRLLQALLVNEPTETGVIGREAKSSLKRLPSSVYWAALSSWGIYKGHESLQQYFSQADRRRAMRAERRRRDDDEFHDGDATGHVWDLRSLKLCSNSFPADSRLKLSREESALLLERWVKTHPNSLMTWLARDLQYAKTFISSDRIWTHPRSGAFPQKIRELVNDGRRLDVLMQGAALLYNLQLSEADSRTDLITDYEKRFALWAAEDLPECAEWDLEAFWQRVMGKGHTITTDTLRFVESWREAAFAGAKIASGSDDARRLIKLREGNLKGARSRFINPAALKQWGGAAGTAPMNYRWPTAQSMLEEWHMGWVEQ